MAVLQGSVSLIWLAVLFICLVIEIATMGLTTIWFAGGALVAVLLSLLKVSFAIQFVAFVLVSFVLVLFTRPIAVKYFNKDRIRTNIEELIGMQAIVVSEIDNLHGCGRVTVQGKEWSARTTDDRLLLPGAVVIIRAIDGVKLIVEERKEEF